jgi:hypothetical protein
VILSIVVIDVRDHRKKGVIGCKPSKAVDVAAPGRISFVDAICVPAVMFGGERSRCSEVVAQ